MVSGVLIDLDHFFDFFRDYRLRDIRSFFRVMAESRLSGIWLPLHSYELLALLWLAALYFADPLLTAFAVGGAVHMAFDQFTNPVRWWTYLLTARAWHKFDIDAVLDLPRSPRTE